MHTLLLLPFGVGGTPSGESPPSPFWPSSTLASPCSWLSISSSVIALAASFFFGAARGLRGVAPSFFARVFFGVAAAPSPPSPLFTLLASMPSHAGSCLKRDICFEIDIVVEPCSYLSAIAIEKSAMCSAGSEGDMCVGRRRNEMKAARRQHGQGIGLPGPASRMAVAIFLIGRKRWLSASLVQSSP